jgi:hypothetical protein
LRWLESVEKDLKTWAWGTGDVNSRTENSGGQIWKRLRFNAGRRIRTRTINIHTVINRRDRFYKHILLIRQKNTSSLEHPSIYSTL